jgi:hypothetical protein
MKKDNEKKFNFNRIIKNAIIMILTVIFITYTGKILFF